MWPEREHTKSEDSNVNCTHAMVILGTTLYTGDIQADGYESRADLGLQRPNANIPGVSSLPLLIHDRAEATPGWTRSATLRAASQIRWS